MIENGLPENIKQTVASYTTCTLYTVSQLKLLLLPEKPVQHIQGTCNFSNSRLSKSRAAQPTRDGRGKTRKQPDVTIYECPKETSASTSKPCREKLATEIINIVLKDFTEAVKLRSLAQEPCLKRRPIHTPSPNSTTCSPKGQYHAQNPLQSLCANTISPEKGQCKGLRQPVCPDGIQATSSFYTEAECARLAFVALRTYNVHKGSEKKPPALQLENAMSTLINKLLALELFEPAQKQLRALKKSLLTAAGGRENDNLLHEREGTKEQMTELLILPFTNVRGPLLSLAVTFQFQVLRLIAAKRDTAHFHETIERLQLANPYSPIKLIQAQNDPTDPIMRTKTASQLEALSRLVLSMCPNASSSEDHKVYRSSSMDPPTAFRSQLLALELRSLWWEAAGHKGDLGKDLLQPFGRYLSTFRRRCTTGLAGGYTLAKSFLNDLKMPCHDGAFSVSASPASNGALRSIYIELIEISRQCCSHDEMEGWLEKYMNMPAVDEESPCQRCIAICKKAVTYAQVLTSPTREADIVNAFRDAERHIEGDLHGGSGDLDELLLAVIRLRKTAASLVNKSRAPLRRRETSPSPELIQQCYNICSSCVNFLNRYIGSRPSQSADHPSSQRYKQRLRQALPVIKVFVDSLISVARFAKGDGSDEWFRTDAGLQACLNLATLAQDGCREALEKDEDTNVASSIIVSVSNTYWLRYLHMKQSNSAAKEALKALKASINTVEHHSLAYQQAAQLQTKLEHYGNMLESTHEYRKAVEIYMKAIRIQVEMGSLQKAAAAAATHPASLVFARQTELASLGHLLAAYPRVATKVEAGVTPNSNIFDDNNLEPSQRGIALEYQLLSLIPQFTVDAIIPPTNKAINSLATELLGIYSEQLFPIRRLRVVEALLWFRATQPKVLAPNLVEQLTASMVDKTVSQLNGPDSGLKSLLAHLDASKDAALAIQEDCPLQKQQKVKNAMACWYSIVEQSPDTEALEARIGDASAWLLRLEVLAQYLDAYGLDLQRRSLLNLLSTVREKYFPMRHLELLLSWTRSGLQHLRLGYPIQGGLAFHKAMSYIRSTDATNEATIWFYVAYAEYFLLTGNTGKCEENLALARDAFESGGKEKCQKPFIHDRVELAQFMAVVALLYSDLAARRGQHSEALVAARKSLRLANQAWTSTEKRQRRRRREADNIEELVDPMSKVTVSDNSPANNGRTAHGTASAYWRLAPQLHKAHLQVAYLYRDVGLFNEARHYLERSQKLAESASASGLLSRSLSHLADLLTRSEDYFEASKIFEIARGQFNLLDEDQHRIQFEVNLTNQHLAKGQISAAEQACTTAESITQRLMGLDFTHRNRYEKPDLIVLEQQLSGMAIEKNASRQPGPKKRVPLRDSTNEVLAVAEGTKGGIVSATNTQASLSVLRRSRYDILRQRIQLAVQETKLEQAGELLSEAATQLCTPQDTVLHAISSAEISISRGLDAIKSDSVYCVLPESTVSLPSVLLETLSEPVDPPKSANTQAGRKPVTRGRVGSVNKRVRSAPKAGWDGPGNEFRQAQKNTSRAYQIAISMCPTATLRHLSKVMAETLLNLSAFNLPSFEEGLKPTPSTLLGITDTARSVSVTRGQTAIQIEKKLAAEDDLRAWPDDNTAEVKSLRPSNKPLDFTTFQEQYLNIIPQTWQVLTISLSRSRREILVCRIRSAQSPFILSLPLDRHSSRDPHEDSFGYYQAKTELQEIVGLANYSTHDTQDTSRKGARSAWWEGRAALDARLKDLLTDIENMWFGGFQGVFSQRMPDRDLLSRFQGSLNVVLDNHLPSRRGVGKKQQPQRINLDPRVVELFVALGDPAFFSDMEEPLMDLLYFVIDILQFHGERNAYDEIDFDSMTIEIFDALRQYHEAAKRTEGQSAIEHTILILDKELHCFPWESLPCLDGQAVTRLPSLSSLRDRILQQQQKDGAKSAMGDEQRFCIDRRSGAYILNPAGDLEATQAKFEQPLSELCEWKGLTKSEPKEDQFKEYLQERDIFLYFGHGSGNQYIRSRTIQKLDRCAVALLMGCSSGRLTEVGEFEPYGTPMSYMQAGCPAIVATLWDVTDKDIDRFSETMLQKWGLFKMQAAPNSSPAKKSTRAKGKNKARSSPSPSSESGSMSLDQAVARGRGSCIFRYLNGAAPVVYGIPMFLS
ncbi:MAG: hypothetical protein Q9225_002151 [Loekoesia sp. 1 TL-2023]